MLSQFLRTYTGNDWLEIANQFNVEGTNKEKSDYVRRLHNKEKNKGLHLVIGCVHVPFHNEILLQKLLTFITDNKEQISGFHIVGDFLDLKSLSTHDVDVIDKTGWTLGKEYKEGNKVLDRIDAVLPEYCQKTFIYGNHECFDQDTEILTEKGWVNGVDFISSNRKDLVATLNLNTNEVEYQKVDNTVLRPYSGEMFHTKNNCVDMVVTPNHRVVFDTLTKENNILEFVNLPNNTQRHFIKNAGINNKPDLDISEDLIRLSAWLHSDGSVYKNHFMFYQRLSKSYLIEDLLKKANIKFKKTIRERNTTYICGKQLKKKCEPSVEYYVSKQNSPELCNLVQHKYLFGDWIYELSYKQFLAFLSSYVDGDGSRHKTSPNNSWCIYGVKPLIDQLQHLCVLNNTRCSVYCYRKNQYKLNITVSSNRISFDNGIKNKSQKINYTGLVWCLSVPNTTLVVRRNGKCYISGNCRFHTYTSNIKNYKHSDAIASPKEALKLQERGYTVYTNWKEDYVQIGKYQLFHGQFCNQNPAKTHTLKSKTSCVFFHTHRIDQYYEKGLHGVNGGCLADLESPAFKYASRYERELWQNAFVVINDGEQAELIISNNNTFYFGGKKY